ncbi:MAG: hypothetical protein JST09_19050 [Bacteroidetes bacterium]|nr:hypothetical protein [Bacteroidota bacterium]MBS1610436.1 hypothetical protein [Bacteroidota bacterium]
MKEKTIVSASTLFFSLLTYWYARNSEKDVVPYVMFGGFIGSLIGEGIAETVIKDNKKV